MNKPCIECAHSAQSGRALLCNHPQAKRHDTAWIFRKSGPCTVDGVLFVARPLPETFCGREIPEQLRGPRT